jgi:hypothetical protein
MMTVTCDDQARPGSTKEHQNFGLSQSTDIRPRGNEDALPIQSEFIENLHHDADIAT